MSTRLHLALGRYIFKKRLLYRCLFLIIFGCLANSLFWLPLTSLKMSLFFSWRWRTEYARGTCRHCKREKKNLRGKNKQSKTRKTKKQKTIWYFARPKTCYPAHTKRALIVLQGHSFVFSIQELSNSSTLNPSLYHPQTKKEGAALMRLKLWRQRKLKRGKRTGEKWKKMAPGRACGAARGTSEQTDLKRGERKKWKKIIMKEKKSKWKMGSQRNVRTDRPEKGGKKKMKEKKNEKWAARGMWEQTYCACECVCQLNAVIFEEYCVDYSVAQRRHCHQQAVAWHVGVVLLTCCQCVANMMLMCC